MTTFGDRVFQLGGVPVGGLFNAGQSYFLRPSTGSDGNQGKSPNDAFKTWSAAHDALTADSGDTLYVIAEDNSASGTTDYQSDTLTLSKDGVNYVGVNAGGLFGQRSRIAQLSTATGVAPLVSFTGSNCFMSGIHIFHGVNDATSKDAAISVTGERNHFYRCHFAGIGHATMDVAANSSLALGLGGDENLFEDCVIGLDTIGRGTAANSEIKFVASAYAKRNVFKNCIIPTWADANTHQFILTGAGSMYTFALFENCSFINSSGTTMTEAFDVSATQAGNILLKDCMLVGCTEWEAGDAGNVFCLGAVGDADITGIAIEPAV